MDNKNTNDNFGSDKLPRELEEILLKNHPLKNPTTENTSARKRHYEMEDNFIEDEKEVSEKEKTGSMLNAIKNKAVKENTGVKEVRKEKKVSEDTIKIDISKVREAVEKARQEEEQEEAEQNKKPQKQELPKTKATSLKQIEYVLDDDDDYDYEPVQLVRHKSKEKLHSVPKAAENKQVEKTFSNPEVTDAFEEINESMSKMKKNPISMLKKHNKQDKKEDYGHGLRNLEGKEKEAALDKFFEENDFDDYDYEENDEKKAKLMKIATIGGAVLVVLFLFFAIRTISLSSSLSKANEQIAELEDMQKENEELKLEKLSLEEELQEAKGDTSEGGTDSSESTDSSAGETGDSGEYDTYTVVEGDTFSEISMKVYGTYSGYAKIMAANGITDESALQIGQQLKIPK